MEKNRKRSMSLRLLAMIVLAIFVLAAVVTYANYRSIQSVYTKSYNEKVALTNTLVDSYLDSEAVVRYIKRLKNRPEIISQQLRFHEARSTILRLQAEGVQDSPELAAAWRIVRNFHAMVSVFKDDYYKVIQAQINDLLVESDVKYIYVLADTGVPDMYSFIFDAYLPENEDSIDRDNLGTLAYKDDYHLAEGVLTSGQPLPEPEHYKDDLYGEMYYSYSPLLDAKGEVVGIVGTDISVSAMSEQVRQMVVTNIALAILVSVVVALAVYWYLSRLVLRPVRQLAQVSTRLGEGDLHTSIPDELLARRDEMGQLTYAVHSFSTVIRNMIDSTRMLFGATMHGHLDARANPDTFQGDFAKTLTQFNSTLDIIGGYLDNISEAMFIVDPQLRPVFRNARCAQLFGEKITMEKIVAKSLRGMAEHPDGPAATMAQMTAAGSFTVTRWFTKREGEAVCFAIVISPMRQDGEIINYLVVATDITNLMIETENAQKANQAKSEFLSRISHELRTPLNAIIGMANLGLRDAHDPDKASQRYAGIVSASDHLLGLINDVLDMSRMEAGKTEIRQEAYDFPALMRECVDLLRVQAEEKGLALSLAIGSAIPARILGDPLRVRQILVNLLGNAVKFTETGHIDVAARLLRETDGAGEIEITLADTGIGMSDAFLQRIFKPFEQEEAFLKRQHQGTGLGLSVAHGLITLMGGSIAVDSQVGKGTVFTLVLPYQAAQDVDAAETAAPGTLDLSGKRMLLVDDIEINRMIMVEILADTGLAIECAADGEEAVQLFAGSPQGFFDIIFMDIQMPRMNGYTATQHIRLMERRDARTVPIIAMTANALAEDVQSALASGMNDHLSKPIDITRCYQVLRQYLMPETPA